MTDLAQQLSSLAVRQHAEQGRRRGKASLLFTNQEAAEVDNEAIYNIALEGLDQLCALDGRFEAYRRTLFGQASQVLDRDGATPEVNAKLDTAVAGFCTLLSSYFLLDPAFKALEFLVRKYRVHELNVEELMAAALPYHETEQFVRLVQILRLEPHSRWAFLEPMQHSGAPLPRESLVLRCITDRSLLRFVCDIAQRHADPRMAGRVTLPFYAVVVCDYVVKLKAVDETLLTMLLPFVLAGLTDAVVPDYRAATYMIIGQLSARATFSQDLVLVLATEICRSASPALLSSAVILLAHLANCQEHLSSLPERAFKHLAKVAGVVDELAALSEKGCRIERLLILLVRAAMELLPAHPQYEQLLQTMLTNVQMGGAARTLADAVLQHSSTSQSNQDTAEQPQQQDQRRALVRLLRSLDLRYSAALDAALDAVLLAKAPAGDASAALAGLEGQQHALALLTEAFEGTARSQLLEAGTTVLLAAEAPAAGMRQLAVKRLDSMLAASASTGTGSSEASAAAGAALLRRLDDESNAVVQAALGCPSLMQLPPIAVFEGLSACFDRATRQAADRNLRKAQRAEARGVARKALKLVAGPLLAASPALLPRILPLVLAALLVSQACGRKVAETAAKVASKLGDPLLAGLEGLQPLQNAAEETATAAPRAQPTKRKGSGKKGAAVAALEVAQRAAAATAAAVEQSRMAADAAYNGKVLGALASHAAANADAGGSLAHLLLTCHNQAGGCQALAEPLLLMTAHAVVQQDGRGAATVAAALVQQLQEQAAPDASASGDSVEETASEAVADVLPKECFQEDGVPTSALLQQFARGQLNAASMRSTAVLAALRYAPWDELALHDSKDLLRLVRTMCALRWRAALAVLSGRMAHEGQDAAELLSVLFAAPADTESLGVRVGALQFTGSLLEQAHTGSGRNKKASSAQQPGTLPLLARLMCALYHPASSVRKAAVGCVRMVVFADRAGKDLAAALSDQAASLEADADVVRRILAGLLGVDAEPSQALAQHMVPPAEAANLGRALLEVAVGQAVAAGNLYDGSMAVTAAHTARVLLEWLAEWAPALDLMRACHKMITATQGMPAQPADSPTAHERELLLTAVSTCFNAHRLETLVQQGSAEDTAAVLATWCDLLQPAGTAGTVGGRLAALKGLQGRTFAVLPPDIQGCCIEVLLQNASKDPHHACRCAARDVLASLPLAAGALAPLLSLDSMSGEAAAHDATMADASPVVVDSDEQLQELVAAAVAAAAAVKRANQRGGQRKSSGSAQKRGQAALEAAAQEASLAVERRRAQLAAHRQARRQGRMAAEDGQLPLGGSVRGSAPVQGIEGCASAMELLLWKDNVQERHLLVPAVQTVLEQLLSEVSNAAAAEQLVDETANGERAAVRRSSLPPAEAMYLVQLCLSVLQSIAQQQQHEGLPAAAFDLALAVRAAQQAANGAVRNAALELIAALAVSMPQAAVDHVLDVVAVVGNSAMLQDDEQSERVAAQALSAILPAWIAAGNSLQQLAGTVVAALPRVSTHRRLPLLSALVSALPQVEGLCSVLALLLQQAVGHQQPASARVPPADVDMADEAEVLAAPDGDPEYSWTADLAADLMEQAPLLLQASVAAALLEHSLETSKQQPWQPLPLLSVAFVTQLLEQRRHAATASSAEELTAAYQRLMQQALLQLQALGERQAAVHAQPSRSPARASAASPALLRAGTAGCYRLLHALQHHMPPATFLEALVSLAGSSPADRVRRKALQLFVAAVEEASAAAGPGQEASDAAAALATAAVSVCEPAVQMLQAPDGRGVASGDPVRYLTKQTALGALGTVAGAFGAQHPERLLAALPAVLAAAKDEHAAVRGSALAATASMAAAMGPQLVPLLPQTIAAVIEAVQVAAATVASAVAKDKPEAGAEPVSLSDASGSDSDGRLRAPAKQPAAAAARASGVNAAAALELAAALAAVAALVEHLGAFLAPHLAMLLSVLLHPAVLQCKAARCADVAAAIRRQLAQAIPTRLLLAPLMGNLDVAAEAGADSACGLLRMLGSAVETMDASALASHHEAVFGALLRALDLRRRRPAALLTTSDGLDRVERAAVDGFVALTMRLTDARFKPLFFRLLEWAHAVPAGDTAGLPTRTAQLLRSVALFSLVNALAERLRGVFVPYFSLLLDACVAHLTDGFTGEGKKSKKKRRKSIAFEDALVEADATQNLLYVEHDWRLRLKVIRTLHRCFLYDTGAAGSARFLDEARFQRLLPPLVAHLDFEPPARLTAVLQADGNSDGGADLEASLQLGSVGNATALEQGSSQLDPLGRAVVACLAQLAVTAGSDAQWKPLNHQVLMRTRSLEPRTRLLALETVQQLVARLAEEYLVLLPETLPFLAELLEDAELAVESAAAALVRRLEELSGESLEQYLR